MPRHHHRNRTSPDTHTTSHPETDQEQEQGVLQTPGQVIKHWVESMDTEFMDAISLFTALHPDVADYVAAVMAMTEKSKAYSVVRKSVAGNVDDQLKYMFSVGLITGASCMLEAVDRGYVDDGDGGDDNDEDGYSGEDGQVG